jgi:polar amino acid transport system substrate-binding protein
MGAGGKDRRSSMHRRTRLGIAALGLAFVLLAAACANNNTGTGGTQPKTLLNQILANKVLRISTDPAYPPQSSYDEKTGKWKGFDIDVGTEIAKRLGVTVQWATPSWDVITGGHWNGRWDLSVGSMTITAERATVLDFSTPYYYTPAGLAVQKGSSISSFDQLAGKTIGACTACTYESYLERKLHIPGYKFQYLVPANITFKGYDTDSTAIQDLVLGRLDAVMSAVPTLQGAIDKGKPIQLLGNPVFFEPLAAAADKSAPLPPDSFITKVTDIIIAMHADGTLSRLSMKWYGEDLTTTAG